MLKEETDAEQALGYASQDVTESRAVPELMDFADIAELRSA
jgi:hypothetical protein